MYRKMMILLIVNLLCTFALGIKVWNNSETTDTLIYIDLLQTKYNKECIKQIDEIWCHIDYILDVENDVDDFFKSLRREALDGKPTTSMVTYGYNPSYDGNNTPMHSITPTNTHTPKSSDP